MKPLVIKRTGERDGEYSREKLKKSILVEAAALNIPDGQAEEIAKKACNEVEKWLKTKTEVTSNDIRLIAAKSLKKLHEDLAYIYGSREHII